MGDTCRVVTSYWIVVACSGEITPQSEFRIFSLAFILDMKHERCPDVVYFTFQTIVPVSQDF
jgi:hypothetical protein